jgi:hypothetical protein
MAIQHSSNALHEIGVVQIVLSYVGAGHHLFVALVSKSWREVYTAFASPRLTVRDKRGWRRSISCASAMTLFSCAFASPSRVKLALESGFDCTSVACKYAAGKLADVATLAAAHGLGMLFIAATMAGAAECNKLAEVQYLHSQGCAWPAWLLNTAASSGYFELVRWCYEHSCPWAAIALAPRYAAENGTVELMAWMLQQPGIQLSAHVMHTAVSKNHKSMCKFLRAQRCPWDKESTNNAARSGRVKLLRWLVDNGCPWEARHLCLSAAQGGSLKVIIYLQQDGILSGVPVLTDMLGRAGQHEKLAAAKWLREQGAQWPTDFINGPWTGEVLAWARAEGFIPATDY